MNRDQQRLADYLGHIREAIERIQRYVADIDEVTFLKNDMTQDAVIRNLEILGEASHNIESHYPEFTARHPELPLAFADQMRNAVAHGSQGGSGDRLENHFQRPSWLARTGAGDSRRPTAGRQRQPPDELNRA